MIYRFSDYCVCPVCRVGLRETDEALVCISCAARYEIRNGIPVLLPRYEEKLQQRYFQNYEELARDDLESPIEQKRDIRHSVMLDFIGDVEGKKVLDIGSSNAIYLSRIGTGFRVAFDLAHAYLRAIPERDGIARVCGDAEALPFKAGFFDVVIISDILEHVLDPEKLIVRLKDICRPDTRVIVHVPWEEDLSQYHDSKYEFAHLRKFTAYSFAQLCLRYGFVIRRTRDTYPSLEEPIIFKLEGRVPRPLYNLLVYCYYHTTLASREYQRRSTWIEELPRRERWLLYFYEPKFRLFELRALAKTSENGAFGSTARRLRKLLSLIR